MANGFVSKDCDEIAHPASEPVPLSFKNCLSELADQLQRHHERLAHLVLIRVNPALLRRLSVEDILQEVFITASRKQSSLQKRPEVPVYVKLRTMLIQTIIDLERHHLGTAKRSVFSETCSSSLPSLDNSQSGYALWDRLIDSVSSPQSKLFKLEQRSKLRTILSELSDQDKEILELRHFEQMTNQECAAVLNTSLSNASQRYIRALKRLKDKLSDYSDFNNKTTQ